MRIDPREPERAGPERALHRVEDAVLAVLLGAIVLLAPLQIALRELFGTGLAWVDPLLRALVLWVGLLGALAASRDGRQISIDAISRILPARARAAAAALTSLITAGISGLVAYHGARFVHSEFQFESVAFSGIPAWLLESVIPFAFGWIALRYLLLGWAEARALRAPRTEAT